MRRRLGVNIDHMATLRQARQVWYPDPVQSLAVLKECSVDQVTLHLREDRRHIQDRDVERITASGFLPVNLEMAVTDQMVEVALQFKPHTVTFVPEKREEITTEGGLDCVTHFKVVQGAVRALKDAGLRVSLFVDPNAEQVSAAKELRAHAVELHTGAYCHAVECFYAENRTYAFQGHTAWLRRIEAEIRKISESAELAAQSGLKVFAGHGLHRDNLALVAKIPQIEEYNIGHAIVARAVFVGLKQAIGEIQEVLQQEEQCHPSR